MVCVEIEISSGPDSCSEQSEIDKYLADFGAEENTRPSE